MEGNKDDLGKNDMQDFSLLESKYKVWVNELVEEKGPQDMRISTQEVSRL